MTRYPLTAIPIDTLKPKSIAISTVVDENLRSIIGDYAKKLGIDVDPMGTAEWDVANGPDRPWYASANVATATAMREYLARLLYGDDRLVENLRARYEECDAQVRDILGAAKGEESVDAAKRVIAELVEWKRGQESWKNGKYENGHMHVETDYYYAEKTKDKIQKVIDDYNVSRYYALISELRTQFQFIIGDKRGIIIKKTENAALVLVSDGTLGEIRPLDEKRNVYVNSVLHPISASEAECGYGDDIAFTFEDILGKINTRISTQHKETWPETYVGNHIGMSKEDLREVLREKDTEYAADLARRRC